jgi:cobalt-precorrin-5B (C1)-methyltransferase
MNTRQKRGRDLRTGYTTGTCAAAAARAASLVLLTQTPVESVEILMPSGLPVRLTIQSCMYDTGKATCSIIKDAGDDPDITDGIEIQARATWICTPGISIVGGTGVGRVTKPGLDIPVGDSAINATPYQMILKSVDEILQASSHPGLQITILVPRGEELAPRTLNYRLGIVGGISIIGTSGIVIPYSVKAYTACISKSLDVATACGCDQVVFTTGRRSEKYAQNELRLDEEAFILAGDYIGYSLKESTRKGMRKAIIWGMIGKISKLAAGHLYTNVSDSVVDLDMLMRLAATCRLPSSTIEELRTAVTANHFRKLLPFEHLGTFCDELCNEAAKRCSAAVDGKVVVECIITDPAGTILGRSDAKG